MADQQNPNPAPAPVPEAPKDPPIQAPPTEQGEQLIMGMCCLIAALAVCFAFAMIITYAAYSFFILSESDSDVAVHKDQSDNDLSPDNSQGGPVVPPVTNSKQEPQIDCENAPTKIITLLPEVYFVTEHHKLISEIREITGSSYSKEKKSLKITVNLPIVIARCTGEYSGEKDIRTGGVAQDQTVDITITKTKDGKLDFNVEVIKNGNIIFDSIIGSSCTAKGCQKKKEELESGLCHKSLWKEKIEKDDKPDSFASIVSQDNVISCL